MSKASLTDGYGRPVRFVVRAERTRKRVKRKCRLVMWKGGHAPGIHSVAKPKAILSGPTILHGTLMEDATTGRVTKGTFRLGRYELTFEKASRRPAILTIVGECLNLPYHMVVSDWEDALVKGTGAVQAFESGAVPDEGVFRKIGEGVSVKFPGRFKS